MGLTGTFVVTTDLAFPSGEVSDLLLGWRSHFDASPRFPADALARELSGSGEVLVASVLDSDYCELAGARHGEIAWRWVFGEPPLPGGSGVTSDNDGAAAAAVAARIAEWAALSGLPAPDATTVAAAIDRGYVLAEDGLAALLTALGLAAATIPAKTERSSQPLANRWRVRRAPTHADTGFRAWFLRVDTHIDLYERVDALADWLDAARDQLLLPIAGTYPPEQVRWAIEPHADYVGPPDGLIVLCHGWSAKNRLRMGSGDDAGWHTKLRQLRRGELRSLETKAESVNGSGRAHRALGSVTIGAQIRDQFVVDAGAPLPLEYPACVYASANVELSGRVWPSPPLEVLTEFATRATEQFDATGGFIELARPEGVDPNFALAPISSTAWSTGTLSDGQPATHD